jgi:NADPH:quinone reductase-like Zn-dependent oxidoreductase
LDVAMKAIVHREYGPPGVLHLEDVPRPVPAEDEVLLRVRAAGVNWADYSVLTGIPYMVRLGFGLRRPRQGIRGTDVAGEVEAVGTKVTQFKAGDRVFGWCKGAFAEYVAVAESDLAQIPDDTTFEEAAAVPMAGMVALQALRDVGEVQSGQKALVVGASGGIGTFAVQIAKSMGAEVTGVSSTSNIGLVDSLGADHVIDYTKEDFTESDAKYDFILDIADTHSLAERRRVLTPKGVLVPNSGEGGRLAGSLGRIVGARLVSLFVSQKLYPFLSLYKQEDLEALKGLIESGDVKPVVGRAYPLEETADALGYVGRRHSRGKTVVMV